MTERIMRVKTCNLCPSRYSASMRGQRNIYCADHDCWSITEDDDKNGFPDWCPLEEPESLSSNKPIK